MYNLEVCVLMRDANDNPYFMNLRYDDCEKFPDNSKNFENKLIEAVEDAVINYGKINNLKMVKWEFIEKEFYDKIMANCEMETQGFVFDDDGVREITKQSD